MRLLSLALAGLLGLTLAASPAPQAAAQAWPDKPVTLIVPFPAGSAVDFLARTTASELAEKFGKPFIVDNRTGAGGNIGGLAVAKAAPDGYTMLFGTPSPIAINKLMYKGLAYDSDKDFTPVVYVARSPLIITARSGFPANSFAELIDYAKKNPGKVNVGNPGYGTLGHITGELISQFTGVTFTHVPYRGTVPLTTDLLGGQVDLAMDFMPTYVPQVKEGKIKAFAVTTAARAPQLPDVPTVQETGFKGFEASAWYAMVAPTGTPRDVIEKVNKGVNEFLKSEKGKKLLEQNTLEGIGGSPEDLKAHIAAELAKWKPVIQKADITLQ